MIKLSVRKLMHIESSNLAYKYYQYDISADIKSLIQHFLSAIFQVPVIEYIIKSLSQDIRKRCLKQLTLFIN